MASLQLRHLEKIYDNKVQAVYDFDLDVNDGELIVLVGPSGCGKSTTLRMVAGLEDISKGNLIIDGKDITKMPPKDRDIAMVFQNYALYSHMTIYENMAFSLVLRKENKNVIHEKVLAAAEILGLTDQLNKKPAQLSGGQRQRVAMGRAIVRTPKVFLFDEPLSNLDAKLRGATRREILLLHKRLKATMLYVTHDQTEALTLADRIVCMSMGHVQQIGTPLELYDTPANIFVASFIGLPPMNFVEGMIQNGAFVSEDFTYPLNAEQKVILADYEGKTVTLGVRPENAVRAIGDTGINLKVSLNENLGQTTLVHGRVGKTKLTCKFREWATLKPGDEVMVEFNRVHFFDKETTDAIRYMNLVYGRIENDAFVAADFTYTLNDEQKALLAGYVGKEVVFGVSPANVVKATEDSTVILQVSRSEKVGQATIVHGCVGNTELICKSSDWAGTKPGDEVKVAFDQVHFFDKETTNAIR